MKKKMRSALIASGVVALLAVIMTVLLLLPDKTEPEKGAVAHTHDFSSSDTVIKDGGGELIIDMDYPDITCMVLQNKYGRFTMRANADGTHTIDELKGLPQNDEFISMAMANGVTLGYSNIILNPEGETPPLTQYGLADPEFTVTVYKVDGGTVTYHAGIEVPDSDGMRYFTVDGYQGVFITEFSPALVCGESYWLSDVLYNSDPEGVEPTDIGRMVFSGSGFAQAQVVEPVKTADESDPFASYKYIQTSPFRWACDDYYISLLSYELGYLSADEAMCAFPTDEEKAGYGLDAPALTVEYVRAGVTYTVRCSRNFDKYFYFMISGYDCIYRQTTDSCEVLSSMTDRLLLSADVHVRAFETVSSVTVSTPESTYSFRLEEVPSENEGGLTAYYAYCEDKKLTLAEYKDFLDTFNSAICVEFGAEAASDTPAVTVRLTYFERFGRPEEVITYTPTAQRRYLCAFNGDGHGAVSSIWINRLLDAARSLAGGE